MSLMPTHAENGTLRERNKFTYNTNVRLVAFVKERFREELVVAHNQDQLSHARY